MGKEIVIPSKAMANCLACLLLFLLKLSSGQLKSGQQGLDAMKDLVKNIITEWEEAKDATENKQG